MSVLQAAILGLVQGVTEFFPISSSAHLILTSFFLHWEDQGLYFDIAVHLGSMVAVLVYLRHDLASMFEAWVRPEAAEEGPRDYRKLSRALLVGTVPVAVGGLMFQWFIASTGRRPIVIATASIVFGIALLLADRMGAKNRRIREIGWRDGLLIGLGQVLALVPGTSRAGITMTVALALGYDRASAVRFSFLLAVPVSVLVAAKQLLDLSGELTAGLSLTILAVGFCVSGVAAYFAIEFLVGWLRRQDFSLFVVYRILLGLLILVMV